MFGLFKKKNYTKELLGLLILQNDIMKDLVSLFRSRLQEDRQIKDREWTLDKICGDWSSSDLGISVNICKVDNNYYISFDDPASPRLNAQSYPIKVYRQGFYFVLDEYAIFIDYNEEKNMVYLEGNVALMNKGFIVEQLTRTPHIN